MPNGTEERDAARLPGMRPGIDIEMATGYMTDIRYQRRDRSGGRGAVSDKPPQYMSASWKDVPFYCDTSSDEFGRRGDLYEYPLSDRIAYKDLGKKAIRFKLEGYLIGAAELQINLSREMARKAQDPNPGYLQHPIHGRKRVACVTLTMTADYRKDKKRTRLSFEFVEANPSNAPYQSGGTADQVFDSGTKPVAASVLSGAQNYNPADMQKILNTGISSTLADFISAPRLDEAALDAQARLKAAEQIPVGTIWAPPRPVAAPVAAIGMRAASTSASYYSAPVTSPANTLAFATMVARIDYGAATVRRLYTDALERLRDFNRFVVQQTERITNVSVQSLVIATRVIIAREMAVAMMQRQYETVKAALDDLDLIVAIYDEEEEAATRRCDDVLVAAIRHARAIAIEYILVKNIRLPGIVEFPTNGLWPSLVVAQKLYANGQRYEQIENYNPTMIPFWMGNDVIAPAR